MPKQLVYAESSRSNLEIGNMGFKLSKQVAAVHDETVKDVATEFFKLDEKVNGFTEEFGV